MVSGDADAFKTVSKDLDLEHQVFQGHVTHNTEKFIGELEPNVASDADGSVAAIGITPKQALQDLQRLGELILSR